MSSDETSESEFKPSPTSLAAALSPWNGIDVYLYCVTLKRHSVLKSFSPFSFKVNSTVATDKFYSLRFLTMLHNCYVIIRFHNLNTLSSQKTFRLTFLCSEEFQVLFCEIFVRLFSA
jgi:hypothetical protein